MAMLAYKAATAWESWGVDTTRPLSWCCCCGADGATAAAGFTATLLADAGSKPGSFATRLSLCCASCSHRVHQMTPLLEETSSL